jgi:hypothetical protein
VSALTAIELIAHQDNRKPRRTLRSGNIAVRQAVERNRHCLRPRAVGMLRLDLSMAVPDVLCDRARPQKNVAIICAIRREFPQDSASARPRAWPISPE